MSDKELLELAAKAAGIKYYQIDQLANGQWRCFDEFGSVVFSPLTDDGDALRLAVKLDLLNKRNIGYPWPMDINGTRRAIVRAAAEIGKELK